MLVTGLCSIIMQGTVTQISVGLGCLVVYMVLYSYKQVYRTSSDTLNMIVGQCVSFFVLFLGMLSRMQVPNDDGYEGNGFTLAIIVVGTVPLWLILYTLYNSAGDIKAIAILAKEKADKKKLEKKKRKEAAAKGEGDSDDESSDEEEEANKIAPKGNKGNKVHIEA